MTVTLDAKRQIDLPFPSVEADDSAGIPPDESDERVIAVVLDRGDGLKVRLTTPAAGWSGVAAAADPEAGTVALTFAGAPVAMRRDEHDVLLPAMRLTVE